VIPTFVSSVVRLGIATSYRPLATPNVTYIRLVSSNKGKLGIGNTIINLYYLALVGTSEIAMIMDRYSVYRLFYVPIINLS
jgi:hypothetical protein